MDTLPSDRSDPWAGLISTRPTSWKTLGATLSRQLLIHSVREERFVCNRLGRFFQLSALILRLLSRGRKVQVNLPKCIDVTKRVEHDAKTWQNSHPSFGASFWESRLYIFVFLPISIGNLLRVLSHFWDGQCSWRILKRRGIVDPWTGSYRECRGEENTSSDECR